MTDRTSYSSNMRPLDSMTERNLQTAPQAPAPAQLSDLHRQAAMLSKLPVVSKLLANPGAVDQIAAQSPQLAQMMAANPFMKDMLQPQAVSQLLWCCFAHSSNIAYAQLDLARQDLRHTHSALVLDWAMYDTVNSLCNNCFGYQATCSYIELS